MSKNLEKTYNPKEIEAKLYEKWCEEKYFHAEVDRSKKPFTTVMPPPNITGKLHMGHALDNSLQDILIRYKRMQGYNALWIPGTDHAAISTEVKVTNQLKAEGKKVGIICTEESRAMYPEGNLEVIGSREHEETVAHNLFAVLRDFDARKVDCIFSESFSKDQLGQAIMNRLCKAAGYHIVNV